MSDRNVISNVIFRMKKNNILCSTGTKGVYKLMSLAQVEDQRDNLMQDNAKEQVPLCTQDIYLGSNSKLENLNWDDFFILKPNNARHQEMRLTITEKGEIRLNTQLNKNMPNRKVQIIFSKDYRTVLLNPSEDDAHIFTKAGTTKNRGIVQVFQKLKLKFPVGYIIKWDENYKMWCGELDISDKK